MTTEVVRKPGPRVRLDAFGVLTERNLKKKGPVEGGVNVKFRREQIDRTTCDPLKAAAFVG